MWLSVRKKKIHEKNLFFFVEILQKKKKPFFFCVCNVEKKEPVCSSGERVVKVNHLFIWD